MSSRIRYRHLVFVFALTTFSSNVSISFAQESGESRYALPGIDRVGIVSPAPPGFTLNAAAGYGYTEAILEDNDAHHRVFGSIAAAIRPVDWLSLALRFDGRYDKHTGEPNEDDGMVGDPRFIARLSRDFGGGLGLGAEASVWLPGKDAPSVAFDALSVDARALATYALQGVPLVLSSYAGFKLDRSGNAVDDVDNLSRADRLGLNLSDFNAVQVGVGAVSRLGRIAILGEWTWDMLLGSDVPDFLVSPMRIAAGARYFVTQDDKLQLQLLAEVSPSKRPAVDVGLPLVPMEPRFAVHIALTYRFPFHETQSSARPSVTPRTVTPRSTATARPAVTTATLRGKVTDSTGAPVEGAEIQVKVGEAVSTATSGPDGQFEMTGLQAGQAEITVRAEQRPDVTRTVNLSGGQTAQADIVVENVLPQGQIRGLVQSFTGRALTATLKIEPLGTQLTTSADGTFEANVPPGNYEVVIEAAGHTGQRRRIRVEENGVTVLNVDLRPGH